VLLYALFEAREQRHKKERSSRCLQKIYGSKRKINEEGYRISDEEIEEIMDGKGKEEIKTINYFQIERKELESVTIYLIY